MDPLQQSLGQPPTVKLLHGGAESPYARQDERGSFDYDPRIRGDGGGHMYVFERFLDRAEVTGTVVNDAERL
jgi:hypothetical protein